MPASFAWKGFFKIGLVTFPVKAHTAAAPEATIKLHQLHEPCKNRIRYQKVCPVHGEVPHNEIVTGYEYGKDEYVIIDREELARRSGGDKAIAVDAFVKAGAIDDIYLTERSYYVVPDGSAGLTAYSLIMQVMREEKLHALAKVVFTTREQLVLLRPRGSVYLMTVLNQENEIRAADDFEAEVGTPARPSAQELKLSRTLVQSLVADHLEYDQYKDEYLESLRQMIEAKARGEEIVSPKPEREPHIVNLMDALRQSVAGLKKEGVKRPSSPARDRKAAARTKRARRSPASARRKIG